MEKLFRIEISTEELHFQSKCFYTALIFSEEPYFEKSKFFTKTIFLITYFFWISAFLEWLLLFQDMLPSIAATFSEELLFHSIFFQSYYFSAALPFLSDTSCLSVSNWAWWQSRVVEVSDIFLCTLWFLMSWLKKIWKIN